MIKSTDAIFRKSPDPVYLVDIIGEVCSQVTLNSDFEINYQYGMVVQILESLLMKDGSVTLKETKYPLIALYMPFVEDRGNGYYADVSIPKVIIAALTRKDDRPTQRYESVFKTVLYPVYYEFLKQLALHKYSAIKDPDMIVHTKVDFPGVNPVSGINDFVDSIEITNLKFLLKQIKYC